MANLSTSLRPSETLAPHCIQPFSSNSMIQNYQRSYEYSDLYRSTLYEGNKLSQSPMLAVSRYLVPYPGQRSNQHYLDTRNRTTIQGDCNAKRNATVTNEILETKLISIQLIYLFLHKNHVLSSDSRSTSSFNAGGCF